MKKAEKANFDVYRNADKTWTWDMQLPNGNMEYGASFKSKARAYADALDFAKSKGAH